MIIGETPLFVVSQKGALNIVDFLIENGADITLSNINFMDFFMVIHQFILQHWSTTFQLFNY